MKVVYYNGQEETHNPQLKNITKIVTGGGGVAEQTQLYGSTNKLLGFDNLNEYGWEYLIERAIDLDPLTFFSDDFKTEVIGKSVLEIENFRNTLVITLTDNSPKSTGGLSYFGTVSARKQKLLMFKCPPKSTTASLYEGDTRKIEITFEGDELKATKLVWMVFTFGGKETVSDINLSYMVWESLENPGRRMKDYLFPLSDIDKRTDSVDENFGNFWFDKGADVLLGNRVLDIEDTPLFNNLIVKVDKETVWERDVSYSRGDVVTYGKAEYYKGDIELPFSIKPWDETVSYEVDNLVKFKGKKYIALKPSTASQPGEGDIWEELTITTKNSSYTSLVDHNRGNNPVLSRKWIRTSLLQSIPKERGFVSLEALDLEGNKIYEVPGVVEPGLYTLPAAEVKLNVLVTEGFIYDDIGPELNYLLYRDFGREMKDLTFENPQDSIKLVFRKFECPVKFEEKVVDKIMLGDERTISIPFNLKADGVTKITLRRTAGSIKEDVEIKDYEITQGNREVLIPLLANYPCSYEILVDWYFAYNSVMIVGYLGFYVDKLIDYKINPDTLMTFRFAPIDGKKHRIKIIYGESESAVKIIDIDERIEDADKKWGTFIRQSFDVGQGLFEFCAEKDWLGYYTLVVYGIDMDRQIKVDIVK